MTKEELALEIIDRLKKEYPDAGCTLDYDDAWKLLVSVRLAAQCTDARVNVVVEDLYAKYPDVNALENRHHLYLAIVFQVVGKTQQQHLALLLKRIERPLKNT